MKHPSILFICRHAPYGNSLARESLEAILAAGSFEQRVSVLFMGDGILQLLRNQDSTAISRKNHGAMLSALPIYDIDKLFVDKHSMTDHQLASDDLIDSITVIEKPELQTLLSSHDHILSF